MWLLHNGQSLQEVHVTKSTYARKRMWQEVRQRNTTWSSEEGDPGTNNLKKLLAAKKSNQS